MKSIKGSAAFKNVHLLTLSMKLPQNVSKKVLKYPKRSQNSEMYDQFYLQLHILHLEIFFEGFLSDNS